MNTPLVKAALWTGPVVVVGLIIAQGVLMRFAPGPAPSLSPQAVARVFAERNTEIKIGCVLQLICWTFYATWSVTITMFIRKMERGFPILTFCSMALVGGSWVFFLLIPMTWAVVAFRIETMDPSLVQIINDWVWFNYLFLVPPFSVWLLLIATAILTDRNVPSLYPRWVAYLSIWCAILIIPGMAIVFFKTGPFAYDGLFAFWLVIVTYFGWMCVITATTFKVINKVDANLTAEASAASPEAIPSS